MGRRFTLFHLDSERGLRGGERQLLYLAGRLRALGHENVVVCRRGSALAEEARRGGLETMHLPFLFAWDPFSAWRLRGEVSRRGGTVLLHAHTAHAASLARLASAGGRPWIAHRRVDFPLSLLGRLKYRAAARVIAVSDFIKRLLVSEGLPESKVAVVRDCLPPERETALRPPSPERRAELRRALAREWSIPESVPWIGNLAALVPHKDQATLLRAAALLLKERPQARLLILGEGPLRAELEALAVRLGISGSVLFAGFQPDPARWLGALDVFALSSWGEGMGSVVLEAMACRVPVVATSAGGIPEVVEHGRTGLLVPPRDPAALAGALLSALGDPASCARRAEEAERRLAGFALERAAERTLELYEEACR